MFVCLFLLFIGETSNPIQPTPQNVPLVDPSLYNVQPAAGKLCFPASLHY